MKSNRGETGWVATEDEYGMISDRDNQCSFKVPTFHKRTSRFDDRKRSGIQDTALDRNDDQGMHAIPHRGGLLDSNVAASRDSCQNRVVTALVGCGALH